MYDEILYQMICEQQFRKEILKNRKFKRDIRYDKYEELENQLVSEKNLLRYREVLFGANDIKISANKDRINELEQSLSEFKAIIKYLIISGKFSLEKAVKLGYEKPIVNGFLTEFIDEIKKESWSFLEFMMSNGFKPYEYDKILEFVTNNNTSISRFLPGDNSFLVPTDYSESGDGKIRLLFELKNKFFTHYYDMEKNEILSMLEILTEYHSDYVQEYKTRCNDEVDIQKITDFDVVIDRMNLEKNFGYELASINCPVKSKYIGFVAEKSDPKLQYYIKMLRYITEKLVTSGPCDYCIVHDSKKEKEFYMVKARKSYNVY